MKSRREPLSPVIKEEDLEFVLFLSVCLAGDVILYLLFTSELYQYLADKGWQSVLVISILLGTENLKWININS